MKDEMVPCKWCAAPTDMTGTKMCDRCWELERRIRHDPDLARRMLAEVERNAGVDLMSDVGYSNFVDGCNVCPTKFVDGKPVRERIEPRGKWMCCVRCGGSYGEVEKP